MEIFNRILIKNIKIMLKYGLIKDIVW